MPLLFAYGINRFSHNVAHIWKQVLDTSGNCDDQFLYNATVYYIHILLHKPVMSWLTNSCFPEISL